MNKAGVIQLFLIVVVVFATLFGAFIAATIYQKVKIQLDKKLDPSSVVNLENTLGAVTIQNWLVPFIFGASIIGIIISSFYIKTHPIMFVASIIIFIFAVIFSGTVSNMFDGVMNSSTLQQFQNVYFTESSWLMNNLPMFVTIAGIIICIVLYSRLRENIE